MIVVTVGERLGRYFELKAAIFQCSDDLGFGAVGDDDVVGEVGRDEEDRTVLSALSMQLETKKERTFPP